MPSSAQHCACLAALLTLDVWIVISGNCDETSFNKAEGFFCK